MKKTILAILVVLLLVGLFAFSAFGEETTVTFDPYEDPATKVRQYCACGNVFIAKDGSIAYVNGEDGCKNVKDADGNITAGCDGTLLSWTPWTKTNALPKNSDESGNYYLTAPVELTGQNSILENVKVALDLNGYEATGAENTRVYSIHKAGASLILTDTSAEKTGKLISQGTNVDHSLTLWVYLGSLDMYGGTIDASQMTTSGGEKSFAPCVRVGEGMTFNMFGGKIVGGNCTDTAGEGGSVYISAGGTMNMYDGEVTGGNAYNGGNFMVAGTLNAYGGKITDGTASNYGGNIYLKAGVANISGNAEISGGNAKFGGGISTANSTLGNRELNITGGTITGNEATSNGGAIYVIGQSTKTTEINISGGIISENYAGSNGGAIYLGTRYASVTISDGSFTDNAAKSKGGHIYFDYLGTHSISGGSFSGGTAANGGSLYINTNVVNTTTITGATFSGGTSTGTGGNIYVAGEISISGATITGGSGTGGGNILVLGTLTLSDVTVSNGEARSGGGGNVFANVSKNSAGTITAAGSVTITSGTFSYGHSSAQGGNLRVESGAALDIQGGRFEYGGINQATGEVVTTQGGNLVILSEDVTITGGTFVGGKAKEYAGNIRAGKDITLGSGVVVQDGVAAKGGNLSNNSGGTLTIDGATVTGGTAVATEGITNAGGGGNIYVESSKTLEIKSGTISDGTAANYGGNIYVNSGTLALSGGTISGGQAKDGGSVALRGGTHTITGGTITGGSSSSAGGNLFVGSSAKPTIDNVTITGGTAGGMGGGLYMGSGTVTINNCLIQGNEGNNGGNVAVYAGTLHFNGGKLENGVANNWGGNLWTDHGTLNIAGGEITGGTAKNYGGGIALANSKNGNRTLNITGGIISGNTSSGGGGLYIHGYSGYTSTVTISGGTITGNTAKGNGGGLTIGTSFCSLTISDDAVIKDNTATGLGGNLNLNYSGTKVISGGTITGGTAKTGSCINVEGKSVTISGTPTIDAIRVNNATDGRLEVTDAAWTAPIPLEVTGQGVFATADTDKTACFTPAEKLYVITYDADAKELSIGWPVLDQVYVSNNGNDYGAGTQADPYQTWDRALNVVSQNGTVHIVDVLTLTANSWSAHEKAFTITGGELVMPETRANVWDNVTFESLTITLPMCTTETSSNFGSYFFYCNGFKTVFAQSATIRYLYNGTYMDDPYHTVTQTSSDGTTKELTGTSTLYGGGPSATGVLTGTDLTVMTGLWGNIYGGSNGVDIDGDVHLTVGGKVNEGVDYVSHTKSEQYVIRGGSRAADIGGTVYMNVTGGTHTSTHGGSQGTYSIGAIELRVTGGNGMAIYGGGRGGVNTVGTVNFYYEGGTFEQVFGGSLSQCLTGNVNLYVTGGNITRRLYGGCYSNCDEETGKWTADNFVTGDVNLYIGSGANISCDLVKDVVLIVPVLYNDRGIYGHSRRAAPGATDAENARIIFLDQAAYNKHQGNLKAQDTVMSFIMRGVTAADYICYLGTNASGNVITVGATEVEDNVSNALDLPSATATITVPQDSYIYEGTALTPAQVTYSDSWTYGELPVSYTGNDTAGTATASITYEGVTASTSFTIETPHVHAPANTDVQRVEGTETHTVTVTCECGEQISQTTEACTDKDKDYVCDLCQGALARPVAQVGETQYTSLQEAIDNAGEGYVKLLADCADAITVGSNLYLDLAGYSLSSATVTEGFTLYLFDSATDDYKGAYGTAAVSGTVETFVEAGGKTYLVVNEDGKYSAHCYEVKLSYVSLDPSNDALGYKAQFNGDEVVSKYVTGFGFNLWVNGGSVKTYSKEGAFTNGQVLTLRLKNIMAANGGEMTINGNAFITFSLGEKTQTSADHSTTMKQVLETVDTNFDSYSTAQKNAVKAMVTKFEAAMTDWVIDKIKAWEIVTEA